MQPNPSPMFTRRAEAFGALLKARRTELGLTQRALAKDAGLVHDTYIVEMEKGRRKPSRAQLDRLCVVLGFDRDDAHAMLGLIPTDIEEAWMRDVKFREEVRCMLDPYYRLVRHAGVFAGDSWDPR